MDVCRIVEDGKGAVLDRISADQVVEGTGEEEYFGASEFAAVGKVIEKVNQVHVSGNYILASVWMD